ncbi:MAG: DotA/TraY family protein [Gammaproteobacteria bacterium]|nr:DotA/TraY family protein [Gammaproteobacteria bacterium]
MSRLSRILLIFLVGFASAQTSNPMDYLIPPYTDISIQYLTEMFGGVSSVLMGPPTIAGTLFEIFNWGILVIAMYLLAYTLTFNLVNEIGSGQPIAHQYDVWTVSRVIVGNALLLPSYSGYSLIQVMVMQVAVYGVGLADSVWVTAINNISLFGSPSAPPLTQDETSFVNDILGNGSQSATNLSSVGTPATVDILWEMTVCAETQYQYAKLSDPQVNRQDYLWRINDNKATVGVSVSGKGCGSVSLANASLSQNQTYAAQNAFYNAVIMLQGYAQSLFENTLTKDESLFYDVLICEPDGAGGNCEQGPELAQVASLYYGALKPFAITTTDNSDDDDQSTANDYAQKGWAAGSFYIINLTSTSDAEPTESSSIDKNLLMSMLYNLTSNVTYKSHSEKTFNDVSQIYWILSQCTGEGACGDSPFGLYDNNTVSTAWKITKQFYVAPATSIIDDTYMPSGSGSSTYCSGNRYLDVATATLYLNWFKHDGGSGAFENLDLDAKSVFFNLSSSADGFDDVYVGFNQRNLYVLLNKVLSDISGMRFFSNMDEKKYNDLNHNNNDSDNLGSVCSEGDVTGCFCAVVSNPNIVTPGRGLMGSFAGNMTSNGQFLTVNPMNVLRYMGLDIFRHSIETMIQSITDAMSTTKKLATNYFAVMATIQVPFIAYASAMAATPALGAGGPYNAFVMLFQTFFTVFQFLQLLDFQQIELYRGILSTFTSITPMIGFMLGIYLPLIPAFYFLFAIVGWLIAVIEAMLAAPIIALGITYPKGHDLLGNSEQGIILLMQLFARPVSIVFGLMAGLILSSILFQLFNYMMLGFLAGYASSFSEFGTDKTSTLIGISLIVLSYAYIAIVIVSNSFTLIYRLPDRILRWIGAPIDPTSVGEMVNEVKRGASDAMSKGLRSGAQTRGEMTSTDSSAVSIRGVKEKK